MLIFVIPRTKHIASKMLDFPEPFRPVIELKLPSLCAVKCLSFREPEVNKPARDDRADGVGFEALDKD